jgi:hypothetical protein
MRPRFHCFAGVAYLIAISVGCSHHLNCSKIYPDNKDLRNEWLKHQVQKEELSQQIELKIEETKRNPKLIPIDIIRQEFADAYRVGDEIWYFSIPKSIAKRYLSDNDRLTIVTKGYVVLRNCQVVFQLSLQYESSDSLRSSEVP